MGLRSILLSGFFSLWAGASAAADPSSCLPEFTSLQAMQSVDLARGGSGEFPLKSENASGLFVSKARMSYVIDPASHELRLRFHFDDSYGGVSLPYNIDSVLILQNSVVVAWLDFTHECKGIGPGIFPGQNFTPPPIKLTGQGLQTLQFMVWGRIN